MFRHSRVPRALVAALLVAALAAPPVSRAQPGDPDSADSPLGPVLAVMCGAGVSIARMAPGVAIVVVATAAACFGMLLDGWSTPDP